MKKNSPKLTSRSPSVNTPLVLVEKPASIGDLLSNLRTIIREARHQALRAVDVVQVQTCWLMGRHIVQFEQGGASRAAYGKGLLPRLAKHLTAEFGKGFDASNLRYMRLFYHAFPNCDAMRHELSWTHYRLLLRVEETAARHWYMNEAANQNWNTRALERQIGSLYYEWLLASKDRSPVRAEADKRLAALPPSPREFIRDPILLEFLGLPGTGKLLESKLEDSLITHLQSFLLELGKGFAFVARQQRISTESKDFYLDLVFYNYLLKCFVLFDLKTDDLTHQDIGQMDMYVRMYDDLRRGPDDNQRSGLFFVPGRTSPSSATPCSTATNSSSPPNTNLSSPPKGNCAPNSFGNRNSSPPNFLSRVHPKLMPGNLANARQVRNDRRSPPVHANGVASSSPG